MVPALAQDRGVVGGLGGVTFGPEKGGSVSGSLGVNIGRYTRVSGELGRLTNMLPSATKTDINLQASNYAETFGDTAVASGQLKATTVIGLVRVKGAGAKRVRPFAEGGFGVARLTGALTATMIDPINGSTDVSSQIVAPVLAGLPATKGLVTLGGGATIGLDKHVGLDLGYRYARVFSTTGINSDCVYAALQFSF